MGTSSWVRNAGRAAVLLACTIGLSACDEIRNKDTVYTHDHVEGLKAVPELPKEEPDIKIISGRQFASVEEADRALRGINDPNKVGMKSPLDSIKLDVVRFDDLSVQRAAMALTEITGQNIVISKDATTVRVNLFLRDVTGRTALETICRMNNLWYREDNGIVRIVTSKEYSQGLVIQRDEKTQIHNLRYASALSIASVLESLFGEQILYDAPTNINSYGHIGTDGRDPFALSTGGGGGGSGNASSARRFDRSGRNTGSTRIGRTTPTTDALQDAVRRDIEAALLGRLGEQAESTDQVSGLIDESDVQNLVGKTSLALVSVFMRNNSIIVRSVDDTLLREIARTIEALDTPTKQVLLEVKILEVALTNTFESFFDLQIAGNDKAVGGEGDGFFRHLGTALTGSAPVAGPTLAYQFLNDRVTAQIQFLERNGRLRSIATPLIMCANNAPAEFFIGEQRPIITEYEFEVREFEDRTTEVARPISEFRDIGTLVQIIPAINDDGTIALRFLTEVASVNQGGAVFTQFLNGALANLPVDTVNSTNVESIVVGQNEKTIVMGGLIRETIDVDRDKVPMLGDIPILGIPFRRDDISKTRTEIVILIRPHIMLHPVQVDAVSENALHRLSDHPYAQEDGRERLLDEDEKSERPLIVIPNKCPDCKEGKPCKKCQTTCKKCNDKGCSECMDMPEEKPAPVEEKPAPVEEKANDQSSVYRPAYPRSAPASAWPTSEPALAAAETPAAPAAAAPVETPAEEVAVASAPETETVAAVVEERWEDVEVWLPVEQFKPAVVDAQVEVAAVVETVASAEPEQARIVLEPAVVVVTPADLDVVVATETPAVVVETCAAPVVAVHEVPSGRWIPGPPVAPSKRFVTTVEADPNADEMFCMFLDAEETGHYSYDEHVCEVLPFGVCAEFEEGGFIAPETQSEEPCAEPVETVEAADAVEALVGSFRSLILGVFGR